MVEGVDYSAARPSGLCLVRNGKIFSGRYFGPGGSWKHATKAEVEALSGFGVSIVSLVEGTVRDPMGGTARGIEHARAALAHGNALGMGDSRPYYFAVDWDASIVELRTVKTYLDGCAIVLGWPRVGVYGGYRTIKYFVDIGLSLWNFQTYAWSGGQWHSRNHIEQYRNGVTVCGGTVDLCRGIGRDYGQWRPGQYTTIPGMTETGAPQSNAETPWEFLDLLVGMADRVLDVGQVADATARQIEQLP